MVNPNLMFHSPPQFVQAQSMADGLQRPVQNLFQAPPGFNPYAGMSNSADSSRPDYSAYFRSAPPMNLPQFQGNPNFYNTLPNGAPFNNPTINLQPEAPGSSRFLRYPVSGNQMSPPNGDQRDQKQQQQTSETDKKPQDSDQISASQDKEDPISVPFGTRIQSDLPVQFMAPRDVYIRYPMKEAGYATEENLPVQNATETEAKSNGGASPFPFLLGAAGRPSYPGFSSPDPYRNALNRVYAREGGKTEDAGNGTKPAEELAPFTREAPLPQFRR